MNYAQGGTRALPDGFLHVQNFTVTKASGIEGAIWAYLMTPAMKLEVEQYLWSVAIALEQAAGVEHTGAAVRDDKHDCHRFRKAFLRIHFKYAVHEVLGKNNVSAVELFAQALFDSRRQLAG
ncbi:hypothetical protein PsPphi15_gp18 [Pseudomonas phage phi15]|uniref:Uncharacterized protein n=1 Tax=Pseudomonas phage phi15 TaxID=988656 RepID=F0V6X9_9CAUD|nr:hypothetical protein PsPphi15_gp18 [Pseudomonas phage phi15]CBZ41991.1 hypothetical protein [Pseudomonas phage phi15]